MTVALLCVADGRHEYHAASYASLLEHAPKFDQYVFVNDPDHRLGFSGAIQAGWSQVETDYVLHWEADFVVHRPIPVDAMVSVLEAHPHLVQMALLRQPWNEAELEAGGIVHLRPHEYEPATWNGHRWLEHRLCTTTNPSPLAPLGDRARMARTARSRKAGSGSTSSHQIPPCARPTGAAAREGCEHIGYERERQWLLSMSSASPQSKNEADIIESTVRRMATQVDALDRRRQRREHGRHLRPAERPRGPAASDASCGTLRSATTSRGACRRLARARRQTARRVRHPVGCR